MTPTTPDTPTPERPQLLPVPPERLAEIREALGLLAQLEHRVAADVIPLPEMSESDKTAKWYADIAQDLLSHHDAREAQLREALRGLSAECEVSEQKPLTHLEGTPPYGWSRECYCSGQQHQINRFEALISAAAQLLGITL